MDAISAVPIVGDKTEANRRLAERQVAISQLLQTHLRECDEINGAASAVRASYLLQSDLLVCTRAYCARIKDMGE